MSEPVPARPALRLPPFATFRPYLSLLFGALVGRIAALSLVRFGITMDASTQLGLVSVMVFVGDTLSVLIHRTLDKWVNPAAAASSQLAERSVEINRAARNGTALPTSMDDLGGATRDAAGRQRGPDGRFLPKPAAPKPDVQRIADWDAPRMVPREDPAVAAELARLRAGGLREAAPALDATVADA